MLHSVGKIAFMLNVPPKNGLAKLLQAIKKTEVEAKEPASFEEFLRRRGHEAATEDEESKEEA